ncbi:cysteine-rich receptor-like protein kinase 25 isoform X2 [Hevea brasiliensis]|uniref:cysteine-rich receptor-like protein kinase 25 isoform X2 n=1 Tax=Hevea brasiliensis TaxID=3981 RepID=UPI0025DC0304|nr:cysteine-rich receptor-like protein kinase 25 isoform X2 [Hevea brasiliensis]
MLRLLFTILVLIFMLYLLCPTSAAAPTYSVHYCTNTTIFTPNSTYQANLNSVLSALASNATSSNGFYNFSAGREPPDVVYGLFLCRGDLSPVACKECVDTAAKEIIRRCPKEKESYIWYEECLLRYNNQSIFSIIREVPGFDLPDPQNVTEPERFNQLLASTMNSLASKAASEQSVKKFATDEEKFTSSETLYSLVQCTPDLSEYLCNRCFQSAIAGLPMCCIGKRGGKILLPSCVIRYELFPFYRVNTTVPVPSPSTTKGKRQISVQIVAAIIIPVVISLVLLALGICFLRRRAMKKYNALREQNVGDEITDVNSLQFDLAIIQSATNNFSADNKIGEGGFGTVYKGKLYNGQEIAVKRLSRDSGQGLTEFKNEVMLVAKLQHKNLVRLQGFCADRKEKILVYEYVPNGSLDRFLFDTEKQGKLNWPRRYKIIEGIARGLFYLQEDSRVRIIHRDLKTSNILLDEDTNAKISDFGMARIFGVDQTQANTRRIVGTFGYMAPEYAMLGHYSVKSDVYSFGVLILEIISGKKNSSFCQSDGAEDLLSYAWKHWCNETPLQFMDPVLRDSYKRNEIIRCMHLGLLCVQENPGDRPTMKSIIIMLSSSSIALPLPEQPGFFLHGGTDMNTQSKELESNQSASRSIQLSVNEMSVTELYPR